MRRMVYSAIAWGNPRESTLRSLQLEAVQLKTKVSHVLLNVSDLTNCYLLLLVSMVKIVVASLLTRWQLPMLPVPTSFPCPHLA